MLKESNIGEVGALSIRLDGLRIGRLPLGRDNHVRDGLTQFLKTEKETKISNIRARFPKYKLEFLKSQLKECRRNIKRIKEFKQQLKAQVIEYKQLIDNCRLRDQMLLNGADETQVKELRLKYPPYSIDALELQIRQFEASIDRCDDIIERDYESIGQIEKIFGLVEHRDMELRNI